jgi:hypothetical protein
MFLPRRLPYRTTPLPAHPYHLGRPPVLLVLGFVADKLTKIQTTMANPMMNILGLD